ncbi:MAG: hypothetical protein NTZ73_01305 [Candidatus Diapherotrites archaeon]|nr:hypothetical protein [Candidatus Diapherotrites archaeon]
MAKKIEIYGVPAAYIIEKAAKKPGKNQNAAAHERKTFINTAREECVMRGRKRTQRMPMAAGPHSFRGIINPAVARKMKLKKAIKLQKKKIGRKIGRIIAMTEYNPTVEKMRQRPEKKQGGMEKFEKIEKLAREIEGAKGELDYYKNAMEGAKEDYAEMMRRRRKLLPIRLSFAPKKVRARYLRMGERGKGKKA